MPRKYPDEFRQRAVALVRAGQSVTKTASDLGITDTCLYNWVHQDRIDRGEIVTHDHGGVARVTQGPPAHPGARD